MSRRGILSLAAAVALGVSLPAAAQFGGMMNGAGGMQGGSGMLVVADDGSVLVTQIGYTATGGPSAPTFQRALVDLGPDGTQRWSASFSEGWPMLPVTEGDLVVVPLVSNAWMGTGSGDTGWMFGGGLGTVSSTDQVTLVGLDLATGARRWSTQLSGDMASGARFAADGSRLYVSVFDMGNMGGMGQTPISQGSAGGAASLASTSVVCLDRSGTVLWTKDLSGSAMMGAM